MKEFTKKHKHHLWIWLVLVILAGVSGWMIFSNQETSVIQETQIETKTEQELVEKKQKPIEKQEELVEEVLEPVEELMEEEESTELDGTQASLLIDEKEYHITVPDKSSVYDFMSILTKDAGFKFQAKEYSGLGFFITQINGIENDPLNNEYLVI